MSIMEVQSGVVLSPSALLVPLRRAVRAYDNWKHRNVRLDERPMVWSLYQRHEDWYLVDSRPSYYIRHKPSNHTFYTPNYRWRAAGSMQVTVCNCAGIQSPFNWWQRMAIRGAMWHWMKVERKRVAAANRVRYVEINRQFAAHFLPKAPAQAVPVKAPWANA